MMAKRLEMLLKFSFLLICILFPLSKASHYCGSNTGNIRITSYQRVQICLSSTWHYLCSYNWDCSDAKVACRQLGYTGVYTYYAYTYSSYSYSPRDNRRWQCTGSEETLTSCPSTTSGSCPSSTNPRLVCNQQNIGTQSCTENAVRLMGGTTSNEGRVELCHQSYWSSICNVDQYDAAALCKQLGYTQFGAAARPPGSNFGSSTSIVYSLSCSSSANNISDCTIDNNEYFFCRTSGLPTCSSSLRCYSQSETNVCTDGSVRLVGGDIEQEGILEICAGGLWGTICSNGWTTIDSLVACKQMGYDFGVYDSNLIPVSTLKNSTDTKPVFYSNFNCQGFESTLSHCTSLTYPHFQCYYNYYNGIYVHSNVRMRCHDDCSNGDVRITGGPSNSEGTVQICRSFLWGLVSDQDWGTEEAQVVCRQLGLQTQNAHALTGSYYGRPDKTVHYSNMNCTGSEDKLTQCGKTALSLTAGKTAYKSVAAAGVSCHGPPVTEPPCISPPALTSPAVCVNGQVQLTSGQTAAEGILQYCYNGQWSHFCTLQPQEATVACMQMGYTHSEVGIFTDGRFGSGSSNYSNFQNITCSSSALALSFCTVNQADCLPSCSPIGIRCYNPGSCEEGAVRLVGLIQQEGRVEVCSNGVWASICDQNWDQTDAHVICKQMGYPELEPIAFHNSYFGDGYGPIIYSNVSCGGWEQRVTDCTKNTYPTFTCSRQQTAGVLCGEHCNDGDIRLVGGASMYEGTVEICFGNLWGLVAQTGWGENDAQVVCRQLEYNSEDAVSYVNSHFGKPNKTIHASGVTCVGDEQNIIDCTMTTYELSTGRALLNNVDVVGVSCTPDLCRENPTLATSCGVSGSVQLTEGSNGQLQYCNEGSWTPACSVSLSEATVACRQLGYVANAWATTLTSGTPVTNVSYFMNFTCTGTEADLSACSNEKICSTCSNHKVNCYLPTSSCTEGSIRLAGGSTNKNGRVEVCYNGVWGTVCGSGWNLPDAIVVCKQLQLMNGSVVAVTNSPIFGQSTLPVVFADITCAGSEGNLLECTRKLHGTFECPTDNTAGVICSDVCSDGDVRLVGGAVKTEGTVEVCSKSLWGAISAEGWTNINAAVVCKQLGYPSRAAVPTSSLRDLSILVHMTDVECDGIESTVTDCTSDSTSNILDGVNVAGVICRNSTMSASSSSTMATTRPTPTTDAPTIAGLSGTSDIVPLAVFVGVFAVFMVLVSAIVIILLVVIMRRTKKEKISGNEDEGTAALLKMEHDNPMFGVQTDEA